MGRTTGRCGGRAKPFAKFARHSRRRGTRSGSRTTVSSGWNGRTGAWSFCFTSRAKSLWILLFGWCFRIRGRLRVWTPLSDVFFFFKKKILFGGARPFFPSFLLGLWVRAPHLLGRRAGPLPWPLGRGARRAPWPRPPPRRGLQEGLRGDRHLLRQAGRGQAPGIDRVDTSWRERKPRSPSPASTKNRRRKVAPMYTFP